MKFFFVITVSSIFLAACQSPEEQARKNGFSVPQGDAVVGEAIFRKFQCYACHSIEGIDFPSEGPGIYPEKILLGGDRARVTSYGELVTAIIDPNHSISQNYIDSLPEDQKKKKEEMVSPMLGFNEEMTVQELIDLASFLHSKYTVKEIPDSYFYSPYPF